MINYGSKKSKHEHRTLKFNKNRMHTYCLLQKVAQYPTVVSTPDDQGSSQSSKKKIDRQSTVTMLGVCLYEGMTRRLGQTSQKGYYYLQTVFSGGKVDHVQVRPSYLFKETSLSFFVAPPRSA